MIPPPLHESAEYSEGDDPITDDGYYRRSWGEACANGDETKCPYAVFKRLIDRGWPMEPVYRGVKDFYLENYPETSGAFFLDGAGEVPTGIDAQLSLLLGTCRELREIEDIHPGGQLNSCRQGFKA